MRPFLHWFVSRAAVVIAVLAITAPALAQPTDAAMTWDVPCGDQAAFVTGVSDLGASFEGFDVLVRVGETGTGSFRGTLSIGRGGAPLVDRELVDDQCRDVVDALVIAAALALRSLPRAPVAEEISVVAPPPEVVTPPPEVVAPPPEVVAPPDEMITPAPPAAASARFALGASLRVGLGPTPGLALAPTIALALEVERIVTALHFAYWPEAAATLGDGSRGVALWALTSSLEIGYRIGDELSVTPCVVLEPSVAFARGVGVTSPRSEATLVLDAGVAVSLSFDIDRVRLFVRADALFGLVRPVYGVEAEAVFAEPVVRGTGSAGLLVFL